MKIKLRYLSKLFVLAFIMFSLNINVYAYAYEHNSEDFKVSYLAGEAYYNVFSIDDKHYVTPSSTDLNIHPMIYSEYEYSGVTKITSAVNKVVIKDDFSSQILLETTSNYIIIDGSRAYYDELVTIQTSNDTFVWNFRDYTTISIYFEGLIDYRPAISGEEFLIVDIDNPISLAMIQSYFKAFDDVDGDLSDQIYVVEDNYTNNLGKPGEYNIIFGVTDSSNNSSELFVVIYVIDIAPPVIEGDFDNLTLSYNDVFSVNNFFDSLIVSDNYQNSLHVEITKDTYTNNENIKGVYEVIITATDESNNKTVKTKIIEVIDQIKPVISGPELIYKSINEFVSTNDIMAMLTAFDEYDGNLTNKISIYENNYDEGMYQAGEKLIVFVVEDLSGNRGYFELNIVIVDQEEPLFYVSNQVVITTPLSYHLTEEMILKILNNHQLFQNNILEITNINFNQYNPNEVGVYRVNINYINNDLITQKAELLINVYNPNVYENEILEEISENDHTLIYILTSIGLILLSFGAIIIIHIKQKR